MQRMQPCSTQLDGSPLACQGGPCGDRDRAPALLPRPVPGAAVLVVLGQAVLGHFALRATANIAVITAATEVIGVGKVEAGASCYAVGWIP